MQNEGGILQLLCTALLTKGEVIMYQVDTSLAMYTIKQAEAVIAQSDAILNKMIDDSLAFNRAMIDFSFIRISANQND